MLRRKTVRTIAMLWAAAFLLAFLPESAEAADKKYSMSYLYFGSSVHYTSAADAAAGAINEVSPSFFDLNADGSLRLTEAVDAEFVRAMHDRGVAVVPFLSNHWNRELGRAALGNREVLAQQIRDAVAQYELDGVCVDIEDLTPEDRDANTDLVRLLRELLPEDKLVTVAVAANPWGGVTEWQGSYDYAGLAQYADYLMLMTYDEHWNGSTPGSVASLGFAERSVQYALQHVPKEKIVLGLAFFGRIWKNGGGRPQGAGISQRVVQELIAKYRGKTYFDTASQTPYAVITIKPADSKPVIDGASLAAGSYTIWYENEASLKAKLALVTKYDLKGAGSWSLGQETPVTWAYYSLWLNGCTFADLQGHWSRDIVLDAFLRGWVKGVTAQSYQPDAPLTRAQAAVMLVRALGLPDGAASAFADTSGHWAQNEIAAAKQYGLVQGTGPDQFSSDRPVTREEMAMMFYNLRDQLEGAVPTAAVHFTDVSTDENGWSLPAIELMSALGLLRGYPDGSFRPRQSLTRAEMAALLTRFMAMEPLSV